MSPNSISMNKTPISQRSAKARKPRKDKGKPSKYQHPQYRELQLELARKGKRLSLSLSEFYAILDTQCSFCGLECSAVLPSGLRSPEYLGYCPECSRAVKAGITETFLDKKLPQWVKYRL
jgi:hypothetical protein